MRCASIEALRTNDRINRLLFDAVGIAAGEARGMEKGPRIYLAYFVAHDAHHRGNALLTLKARGHAVPKDVRYAIWDWGRR